MLVNHLVMICSDHKFKLPFNLLAASRLQDRPSGAVNDGPVTSGFISLPTDALHSARRAMSAERVAS